MTLQRLFLALTLSSAAPSALYARDVRFSKKVDPGALQNELKSAGFAINYIECSEIRCRINMPDSEKKDPLPLVNKYVFVDPIAQREQRINKLRSLHDKWVAGGITGEEKDALLRDIVGIYLGK